MIDIQVITLSGDEAARFFISPVSSARDIKQRIQHVKGTPFVEQRLVFQETELADETLVRDILYLGYDSNCTGDEESKHEREEEVLLLTLVRVQRLWALAAFDDGCLQLWDLESSDTSHTEMSGYQPVRCVSVDWAARMAISAGSYQALQVWDLSRATCVREMQGEGETRCVAMDWCQRLVVSAALRKAEVRVWDLNSGKAIQTLEAPVGGVVQLSVSWLLLRALGAAGTGEVWVWNLGDGECIKRFSTEPAIRDISVDWAAEQLFTGGRSARLWGFGSSAPSIVGLASLDSTTSISMRPHCHCLMQMQLASAESSVFAVERVALDLAGMRAVGGASSLQGTWLLVWSLVDGACLLKIASRQAGRWEALSLQHGCALRADFVLGQQEVGEENLGGNGQTQSVGLVELESGILRREVDSCAGRRLDCVVMS